MVVALSELYEVVFADHMTRTFGVEWEAREMDRDRSGAIIDVPEELVAGFSTRARHIEVEKDRYVAFHGRQSSDANVIRLCAQAILSTRPEKQVRSLAELTEQWCTRASYLLGVDAAEWVRIVTGGGWPMVLWVDDVSLELIGQVGRSVVKVVGEKRSTWRRWTLMAEAVGQAV